MIALRLIEEARAAGCSIEIEDGDLVVEADHDPPAELIALLRQHKAEVMATLMSSAVAQAEPSKLTCADGAEEDLRPKIESVTNPKSWRNFYAERIAYHDLGGRRLRADAERVAYGECVARWHQLFGTRWPPWQCVGCEDPIGGKAALTLSDGARVHFDDKLSCLFRYGERWRGEAVAGLRKLAIDQPREHED